MKTYVFDLDGTIISNGKPIHPIIASSINELTKENKVIFSSARPIRDMLPLLTNDLKKNLLVGCNGGMAWKDGVFLFTNSFPTEIASNIISFLDLHNIAYVIDGSWNYHLSYKKHHFHDYMRSLSNNEISKDELVKEGISKFLILEADYKKIIEDYLLVNKYDFNINYHKNDESFDITPQRENKYSSLERLGIDFSKVISFGNDANDYVLLDKSKISVFVGSMADYPNATYYCRTEYIPTLLPAISDTYDRGINRHYVNKQQISYDCIEDILRIQKSVSSWVACEGNIKAKLDLAEISAWIGYSLDSLYSIALERSIFNEKRISNIVPKMCSRKKINSDEYHLNYGMLFSLEKSIKKVILNIESAKNNISGNRYHQINERMGVCIKNLEKTLSLANKLCDRYENVDGFIVSDIVDYTFKSPHLPKREETKKSSAPIHPTMKMMYSNYINLEIPTIECCTAIINDFDYKWVNIPFIVDISKQIEDEIFHSKILLEEYEKRGGVDAAVDTHFRFWEMARNEELATRLYIHQKMGEWIGIDAAINQIIKSDDEDITEIYTSIVCDELNHTRLGTKWIDQYSEDYSLTKEKALSKRSEYNETDTGPVKFPVNEHVCNLCNFKEEEISEIKSREKKYGALNA